MDTDNTNLSAIVELSHNNHRIIKMTGEVNEDLYEKTISNLILLDDKDGDITILINSPGGDIVHGKAMYDAIRNCRNFVRGIVYGQASSAASIVLQACDERLISENSFVLLHYGEEYTSGHPLNKERWDEHYKFEREWMISLYYDKIKIKKPRFTKKKVKDLILFDKILTSKKAVDYNIVDGICKKLIVGGV